VASMWCRVMPAGATLAPRAAAPGRQRQRNRQSGTPAQALVTERARGLGPGPVLATGALRWRRFFHGTLEATDHRTDRFRVTPPYPENTGVGIEATTSGSR